MIISTKAEKKANSLAAQIPMNLWETIFKNRLCWDEHPIEGKPFAQIIRRNLPIDSAQAFILTLILYSDAEAENLIRFAQEKLRLNDDDIFTLSAAMGKLNILNWFTEQAPDKLIAMIQANNYHAFRFAAADGHIEILNWLIHQIPDELMAMIQANNYCAFSLAAANDHVETLNWFAKQAPHQLAVMIEADRYSAFREAAFSGHREALNWLTKQAPHQLAVMIEAGDYFAFRYASKNGHLEILNWLAEQAPHKLTAMIKADRYFAFTLAAANGHLNTLKWLAEQAPHKLMIMIRANRYHAFSLAAGNGHAESLNWLFEHAPDELSVIIKADRYFVFRQAVQYNHRSTCHWLLQNPECLAYAENYMQEYEYEHIVNPFIQETLDALHQANETHAGPLPYDLTDPTKATHCFYLLRHLIRLNQDNLNHEIRFLLSLPSVRVLAHEEGMEGEANELLRLALSVGNQNAARLLLSIDAVSALAEVNNFYRQEINGGIDLLLLTQDDESSMPAEQDRLAAVLRRYELQLLEEVNFNAETNSVPINNTTGMEQILTDIQENTAKLILSSPEELPIDQNTLNAKRIDLQEKINSAILGTSTTGHCYLTWMNTHAQGTRGLNRFSHWYHGESGVQRARELLAIANDPNATYEEIVNNMRITVSESSNTQHSLRNYLKDTFGEEALNHILQSSNEHRENSSCCFPIYT